MRVGVIGTRWGRMHIGGFRRAGAEVVALCGKDPERTRRVAAQERIALACDDVASLCAAVDLVVVAGPDALHPAHVTAALDAGKPVLCEKPLALTAPEADALARRVDAGAAVAAVSFPYRMLPPFVALWRWLAGREVTHVAATVQTGFVPAQGGTGDFGGMSHVIDTALWLVRGTPRWVQASLSGRPVQSALVHVGLDRGAALALTHLACADQAIRGDWTILGAGWQASVSAGYEPSRGGWSVSPGRVFEDGRWRELGPSLEPRPEELEPWAAAHVETARHFLAAAHGTPSDRLASFRDGALVQRTLAAALAADEAGNRVSVQR